MCPNRSLENFFWCKHGSCAFCVLPFENDIQLHTFGMFVGHKDFDVKNNAV
jgi:hypothetical protein